MLNVMDYGAKGDGVTDDTAAIQAAVNACATAFGGCVYFPHGRYVVSSSITYAGGGAHNYAPMRFLGDNAQSSGWPPGGTVILWKPGTAGYNVFDIGSAGVAQGIYIENLVFMPASDPGIASAHTVINIAHAGTANLTNVQVYTMTANKPAVGIKATSCGAARLQGCTVQGSTQAVWMNGGQIMTLSDCILSNTAGTNGSAIWMDNGAATLRIRNSQSQGGDRGLYMLSNGGDVPAFVFIQDYEINIPRIEGVGCVNGSQFWANQLWISHDGGAASNVAHGINFYPSFTGFVNIAQSTFQGMPGHGVWVQGGSGYTFANNNFGNSGVAAPNTYDELHVGAHASHLTISGNHFSVDPYMGISARSAVYLEKGAANVSVVGNTAAGNLDYPVKSFINQGAVTLVEANNIGF